MEHMHISDNVMWVILVVKYELNDDGAHVWCHEVTNACYHVSLGEELNAILRPGCHMKTEIVRLEGIHSTMTASDALYG